MRENYEFFKKEFQFQGKHARMVEELARLNDYKNTYFKRAVDVYVLAPIVGFYMRRKESLDITNGDTKSIFLEQMLAVKEELDFSMQLILLLENAEKKDAKQCIKEAFGEIESKEKFNEYYQLFHEYVRGGVEILYETLVIKQPELDCEYKDSKTENIVCFVKRFDKSKNLQKIQQ